MMKTERRNIGFGFVILLISSVKKDLEKLLVAHVTSGKIACCDWLLTW